MQCVMNIFVRLWVTDLFVRAHQVPRTSTVPVPQTLHVSGMKTDMRIDSTTMTTTVNRNVNASMENLYVNQLAVNLV